MKLVALRQRVPPSVVERMLGGIELFVRRPDSRFRRHQTRVPVGERRFSRLQVEAPLGHLFGEGRVGVRQIGQLGSK